MINTNTHIAVSERSGKSSAAERRGGKMGGSPPLHNQTNSTPQKSQKITWLENFARSPDEVHNHAGKRRCGPCRGRGRRREEGGQNGANRAKHDDAGTNVLPPPVDAVEESLGKEEGYGYRRLIHEGLDRPANVRPPNAGKEAGKGCTERSEAKRSEAKRSEAMC